LSTFANYTACTLQRQGGSPRFPVHLRNIQEWRAPPRARRSFPYGSRPTPFRINRADAGRFSRRRRSLSGVEKAPLPILPVSERVSVSLEPAKPRLPLRATHAGLFDSPSQATRPANSALSRADSPPFCFHTRRPPPLLRSTDGKAPVRLQPRARLPNSHRPIRDEQSHAAACMPAGTAPAPFVRQAGINSRIGPVISSCLEVHEVERERRFLPPQTVTSESRRPSRNRHGGRVFVAHATGIPEHLAVIEI